MPSIPLVDVVILGGGPAGCAAAVTLAGAGLRVVVLERSRYDGPRFGETLPPAAKPLMFQLGLWDAFQMDAPIPSPGIVSAWSSQQPHEQDFIFNAYGHGWHLDRARFDDTLSRCAQNAGAALVVGARPKVCRRDPMRGWQMRYLCARGAHELQAAFLIDATGRSAWLARQQGARTVFLDRLVGVVAFGPCAGHDDHRAMVEAFADGWWYSAVLPNEICVAALLTDADLLPHGRAPLEAYWLERRRVAELTARLWANAEEGIDLKIKICGTSRLDRVTGDGWVAVGDAALAFDPLSSQGIVNALESGMRAAEAVMAAHRGDEKPLAGYAAWVEAEFVAYARRYAHYYSQVTRWPDSPFWKRRGQPAGIAI